MLGAIIGDIVGSRWEFNPTNDYNFELFSDMNDFTDDTVCTIAVGDALLHDSEDFGTYLHTWCRRYPHPKGGYGGRFAQWIVSDRPKPYGSWGNGSAMRVSPVAWAYTDSYDVLRLAELSAACTHNQEIGIKGAQAVALAIHDCLVMHQSYDQIGPDDIMNHGLKRAINHFGRSIDFKLEDVQNHFDETCAGTVPVAFWIISQSHSFEDAIRRAVSLGADADTLGAIVGSIAEAIWGIPEWMKKKAISYLPEEMRAVLSAFCKKCPWKHTKRLKKKSEEEKRQFMALMRWKLGLGDFNKVVTGDNPLPDKSRTATAADWKTEPMPVDSKMVSDLTLNFKIPAEAMKILRRGHIPEVQEDHWFMYCDREYIRYYRSWTGMCVFEAHFREDGEDFLVDQLKINHSLAEFGENEDAVGAALFCYLVIAEAGGEAEGAWQNYFRMWKEGFKD